MENFEERPILLTGATGFIGSMLYPMLEQEGYDIRCASRNPKNARKRFPDRDWVKFDVHQSETIRTALQGCGAAFYLIHEMSSGSGYRSRERKAAINFIESVDRSNVERVVYLGGVAPDSEPSEHLKSRLQTGRILRNGATDALELRASMVIGYGSSSWNIVRDLAARLPVMILPSWTQSRTEPVHVSDVIHALIGALNVDIKNRNCFDIPGPEILSVENILRRTAQIIGNNPLNFRVPLITPKLSSYWLRFITGSDLYLAQELVEGLKSDLLARDEEYWQMIDHQERISFDEAVHRTLKKTKEISFLLNVYESGVKFLTNFP